MWLVDIVVPPMGLQSPSAPSVLPLTPPLGSLCSVGCLDACIPICIDQALAQLEFNDKKGAQIIKEVLLEAQDMAVRDHNVEFRSNLHIAESTSGRGQCLKRIRYHGRGRFGIMEKVYCHYFVKLVEGPPPPPEVPKTAVDHAKDYIQQLRSRTIIHTL